MKQRTLKKVLPTPSRDADLGGGPAEAAIAKSIIGALPENLDGETREDLTQVLSYITAAATSNRKEDEPDAWMTHWRYVRVHWPDGSRTRHLLGKVEHESMVCSPIKQVNLLRRTFKTRSGRVYQLEGASGYDKRGDWVLGRWEQYNLFTKIVDQTKALERILKRGAVWAKRRRRAAILRSNVK